MTLAETVKAIKSLKIQGAQNVALRGLIALKEEIYRDCSRNLVMFNNKMKLCKKLLLKARPTEPFLQNSLKFVYHKSKSKNLRELKEEFLMNINYLIHRADINSHLIAKYGSAKVPKGGTVFTHCHSSSVINVLKFAMENKNFEVHNTEARPLYQGRTTAKELVKEGIKVTHYVDSAAQLAIKNADIMLIGCDAITKKSVINKIGSELFAKIANEQSIPVYVCTDSLKFTKNDVVIEERGPEEIWKTDTKKIKIVNPAFEEIDPRLIKGIICEYGVFSHKHFISELRKYSPWVF